MLFLFFKCTDPLASVISISIVKAHVSSLFPEGIRAVAKAILPSAGHRLPLLWDGSAWPKSQEGRFRLGPGLCSVPPVCGPHPDTAVGTRTDIQLSSDK